MKLRIATIILILAALASNARAAKLTFTGSKYQVITETPDKSTGLDDIYVIYDTNGMQATYTSAGAKPAFYKFNSYGGAYAEEITASASGNDYTIALGKDDMGYIIEEGTSRYYCWVVNYANHMLHLDGIRFAEEQDCDRARLQIEGNAQKISYYTINGQAKELGRQLIVSYTSLEYDENTEIYVTAAEQAEIASIDGTIGVKAPYCVTDFIIEGDRFLKTWGMPQTATSPYYEPIAVEAHTSATQELRENDNEQKIETEGLGGSAPVSIEFRAAVTDAAIFREWQMSRDPEFTTVDDRYQQLDFDYTFRDNGTFYVQFIANNAEGTCEYASETYQVFIGESMLLCPNAFSPGASEGVNDEWKVSYKSIVEFDCHIYNRWGQLMTSFKDPSLGWDGKYMGKLVPAGAYFYVIKALGSDGKKYSLKGDINIVRSKANPLYGGSAEGTTE